MTGVMIAISIIFVVLLIAAIVVELGRKSECVNCSDELTTPSELDEGLCSICSYYVNGGEK